MVLEFCFNQIVLPWKYLSHQFLFWLFYVVITVVWQLGTNGAHIYDGLVNWDCNNPEALSDCNSWKSFEFLLIMLAYQLVSFCMFLGLSFVKVQYICRKSKPILTEPLMGSSNDAKI